jgi:RNA polymerase sigma factor (sigma-70 family)
MTDAAPLVFVIDDDSSVRKSLRRLLSSAGYRPEVFASGEEFLRQPRPEGPACAVLDVRLSGLSGLELQNTLAGRDGEVPIVFITGHRDIPTTVRAMKAGAVDFLVKPFNPEELLAAVRQALTRHAAALERERERAEIRSRADTLSPRESQVMELVVAGLPNKEVGSELGVTEKTVKVHRAQVMRKMQADSLPELVRLAGKIGGHSPGQ